ncbi:MFS transporter [Halomicrococcus sp. SG-WS-1]|uniref:MFS transporter n=1 Tax=Halomicrococcus sp. SG-WS-1 TaxID=3439057 RepID=UPI003F79C0B6
MRRHLFGTLCGLVFLMNFGRTVFAPLLEPLMVAFAVDKATVGVLVSLVWLGTAIPRIPMGYVLTHVSRRRAVLATGVLLSAASGLLVVANSLVVVQAGTLLLGVATGAYFVAAVPLIAELYPNAVGRNVGIHGAAAQLAAVLAPSIVIGVLFFASWRAVFALLAVAAVSFSVVLAAVVRESQTADGATPDREFLAALRSHWRLVATGLLMVGVAGFTWQGLFNFYVTYLKATKGMSASTANLLLTVVFAAGLPAFWFGGRLADRLPHVPYILAILTGFVGSVVALTRVGEPLAVLVVSVAIGYSIHSLFPALDTYVLSALPDENRDAAYASFTGLSLLVEANGTAAVGTLTEAGYGFDAVFGGLAALVGGVVLVVAALYVTGRLPSGG